MAKYHKYVFDDQRKKFVGDFEQMYRQEQVEHFDSWHQEDNRAINRRIGQALIADYNFDLVVDLGCGKGAYTHLFKKQNNRVYGLDIAETAVNIAQERYPDIIFRQLDLGDADLLGNFFTGLDHPADLVVMMEVLSYLEPWEKILTQIARHCQWFLCSLYIPEDPLGFVPSEEALVKAVSSDFEAEEIVSLEKNRMTIILARSKHTFDAAGI